MCSTEENKMKCYSKMNEKELNENLIRVLVEREAVPQRGSRTDPKIIQLKANLKAEFEEIQGWLMKVA